MIDWAILASVGKINNSFRSARVIKNYLAGRQQEALRDSVALVGEQIAQFAAIVLFARLAKPEQRNIESVAQNVLHHNVRLTRDRRLEQLLQVLSLHRAKEHERKKTC